MVSTNTISDNIVCGGCLRFAFIWRNIQRATGSKLFEIFLAILNSFKYLDDTHEQNPQFNKSAIGQLLQLTLMTLWQIQLAHCDHI